MPPRHRVRRIPPLLVALLLVLALPLLVGACGQADDELDSGSDGTPAAAPATPTTGASPTATAADPLAGTTWTLATLGDRPALTGALVTARFANGQLTGNGGCNGYGGAYTVDGAALAVASVVRTEMYCESPAGVMDQEDGWFAALEATERFRLDGDGATLALLDAGGVELATLARDPLAAQDPSALPGTRWALTAVDDAGLPMDLSAALIFDADGAHLTGTAICRDISGDYLAPAGTNEISVTALALMQDACFAPQTTRELETRIIDGIASAREYVVDIDAGTLTLRSARAGTLLFDLLEEGTEPPMSEPTFWILQSFAGSFEEEAPPLAGSEITLRLERDALASGVPVQAGGSAGCNTYATTLTWTDGALSFTPPAATRMFCAQPDGVMRQETTYLETLAAATAYAIDGDILRLTTPDGRALVFMEKQDA